MGQGASSGCESVGGGFKEWCGERRACFEGNDATGCPELAGSRYRNHKLWCWCAEVLANLADVSRSRIEQCCRSMVLPVFRCCRMRLASFWTRSLGLLSASIVCKSRLNSVFLFHAHIRLVHMDYGKPRGLHSAHPASLVPSINSNLAAVADDVLDQALGERAWPHAAHSSRGALNRSFLVAMHHMWFIDIQHRFEKASSPAASF